MQRPSPQRGGIGGDGGGGERGVFAFDFRDSPSQHHHGHPQHHSSSSSSFRNRRHPEPPMSFAPISAQPYGVMEAGRKRAYDPEGHAREAAVAGGAGPGAGGYHFHAPSVPAMEMGYRYGNQGPPGRMMHTGMEQSPARTPAMMGEGSAHRWEGGHAGRMQGGGDGGRLRPARVDGGESGRSPIVHVPPGTKHHHHAYGTGRAPKVARVGTAAGSAGAGAQEEEGRESDNLSFLVGPEEGEEASQLSALVELAAQNLQLKNQLREVSRELHVLQNLVSKNDDVSQDAQWQTRYWSVPEHQRFLEAVRIYGKKNLKAIAVHVGTRSATQVKTHSQKYFQKLARQATHEDNQSSSGADTTNSNDNSNPDADAPGQGKKAGERERERERGGEYSYCSASTASTRLANQSSNSRSNSGSLTSSSSPPSS